MAGKRWTADEQTILKNLYQTAPRRRILSSLPGRNWPGIKDKANAIGLDRPRMGQTTYYWRESKNYQLLGKLYPTMPWDELLSAFPEMTKSKIRRAAYLRKLKRKKLVSHARKNKVSDPLIKYLVNLRAIRGVQQWAIAEKLGVTRAYMSECEQGKANPRYGMLKKWARLLGVEIIVQERMNALQKQAAIDMEACKRRAA